MMQITQEDEESGMAPAPVKKRPAAVAPQPATPAPAPQAANDTTPNVPQTPPVPMAPPPAAIAPATSLPTPQAAPQAAPTPYAVPGQGAGFDASNGIMAGLSDMANTPGFQPATSNDGTPWNVITGADGQVSAQNAAASDGWWATHNSDGSTRMPWAGGAAITPDDPRYASLPGTDTLNRALGVTPGTAENDYQGTRTADAAERTFTPDANGLISQADIAKYNTPEQISAVTGIPSAGPGAPPPSSAPAPVAPVSASPVAPAPMPASPAPVVSAPVASSLPAASGNPSTAAGPGNPVALSTIDPSNDLRNKTVLPQTGVDRFKLVQDRFNDYQANALPAFRNKLRSTYQNAAALGRTGSGMLRTDVGNLDQAQQRDANSTFARLLADATEGTIQDGRSDRAEYRGERAYENGLEQQAYDRERQGIFDEDQLVGSDFGRAMQRLLVGEQGNPSSTLTNVGGQQSQEARNTIASLLNGITSRTANGGSGGGNPLSTFTDWLSQYLKGDGGDESLPQIASTQGNSLPSGIYTGPIYQPSRPAAL